MKDQVISYPQELETLVAFVEGRITGAELDEALKHESMQTMLAVFVNPKYPASTNYFRKLEGQDRVSLGGLTNSEGIVQQFLNLAEVQYKPVCPNGKMYDLLLAVQPAWLDLDTDFLLEHVIPKEAGLSQSEQKRRAKERIKELFQCAGKPPAWIQSPEWPMRDGVPAVFIGQMPIKARKLFHDDGAAYLFFHDGSGEFETLTQFY